MTTGAGAVRDVLTQEEAAARAARPGSVSCELQLDLVPGAERYAAIPPPPVDAPRAPTRTEARWGRQQPARTARALRKSAAALRKPVAAQRTAKLNASRPSGPRKRRVKRAPACLNLFACVMSAPTPVRAPLSRAAP